MSRSITEQSVSINPVVPKPMWHNQVAPPASSGPQPAGAVIAVTVAEPSIGQSLAGLAGFVRGVAVIAQCAHWSASGPQSYSDHLLFGGIYEKSNEHVDKLGERAMAMGGCAGDAMYHLKAVTMAVRSACVESCVEGVGSSYAAALLRLETALLETIAGLRDGASAGVDDLLCEIASDHEAIVGNLRLRLGGRS